MTKVMALGLAVGLLCATGACSKGTDGHASSQGSDNGSSAKNDNGGSATETNVASIHCFEDADCSAGGGKCEHFPGQDDGTCSGGKAGGGPFHPGQGSDEDGGVTGPNTR